MAFADRTSHAQHVRNENLFIFINIGVTGLYDTEQNLSEVKLILIPVSREELVNQTLDYSYDQFDFLPIENHEPGRSLLDYNLKLSIEEYEQLTEYIQSFPGPALVAYNGFNFAFPILYKAIKGYCGLPSDLRCVDLIQGVYETDNGFGPQKTRDDGRLPWYYQQSEIMREYTFSKMFLRTLGYDSGVDESIQGRTKADGDEGLPLPKLRATVRWAAEYQPVSEWLQKDTSFTYFKDFTV